MTVLGSYGMGNSAMPPTQLRTSMTWTLLLGLIFHLIYIMSVFDCYFTSPVVHGMQHFSVGDVEAQRLVLFVADGLRADLLYNLNPFPSIPDSPKVVAPHLREIVETRGAFGVSHTRVPTESRPGHVAIIGGMYEDVSAVTKGWKTNPVDFDSVFNQSRHTFSFGSPDILPMFAKGAVPGRVDTWSYDEEDEDFTRDATGLDIWVLEQLQSLFKNASSNVALDSELRGDKVIFFLHLLGLDTTGHSYRPHSKEYMRNIQVVDEIVKKTEKLFGDFFQDDKTSYIFTADHGMSNIGNHGDGNPDSTRTPLIAWGAGVRGPLKDSTSSSHDTFSASWGLEHLMRRDIEQADIAALMTTLLGIDFPANSVGVLPDVDIYRPGYLRLSGGESAIANAAVANAKSILEHYRVKHRIKAARKVLFTPFPGLAAQDPHGLPGSGHLLNIDQLLYRQNWDGARKEAAELIQLSLDGLRYLETYDRGMLRAIVAFGYIGWSSFSATALLMEPRLAPASTALFKPLSIINGVTLSVLFSFFTLFAIQSEPLTYYFYIAFPCYFWQSTAKRIARFKASGKSFGLRSSKSHSDFASAIDMIESVVPKPVLMTLFSIASLQAMVIAYKHRSIWSAGFIAIGIFWPLVSWPATVQKINPSLWIKWIAVCFVCAAFPLRDVEQSEDLRVIIAGGITLLSAGLYAVNEVNHKDSHNEHRMQLGLILLSIIITSDSVHRLSAKEGLPLVSQVLGWLNLASSALLPMLFPFRTQPRRVRLLTLFLAFAPCFIVLSICAEGLFYLSYCATLVVWVEVETVVRREILSERPVVKGGSVLLKGTSEKSNGEKENALELEYTPRADDVRIALFFLFFVQVAFFGTGNVASISSFYLEPVYRLVPIFSPFIMAALLIFKIIAPYVILSAAFASLSQELHMPPFTLFLIALSLTDGMTITFFVNVTDTGSWLEIGQSISFFVITSLLLLWSAGICALGAWLMRENETSLVKNKRR